MVNRKNNEVYEVERILAEKKEGTKQMFLIKWLNYPDSEISWEPSVNVGKEAKKEYKKQKKENSEGKNSKYSIFGCVLK
jgi:hypothetical protein